MSLNDWALEPKPGKSYYETVVSNGPVTNDVYLNALVNDMHGNVVGRVIDKRMIDNTLMLLLECIAGADLLAGVDAAGKMATVLIHAEPPVSLSPIVVTDMYLHSAKEYNSDIGESLGLKNEALTNFLYALGEVRFDVEVDTQTGGAKILAVDGKKISDENFK